MRRVHFTSYMVALAVVVPVTQAGDAKPPIAKLSPYEFVMSSALGAIWVPLLCVCCLFVFRAYQSSVCPRGLEVLRDLELDDLPDQRFDGIENALLDRLRDPWNYMAMPTINFAPHAQEEKSDDERHQEMAGTARQAAIVLRTAVKSSNKKTAGGESWERPASATATALASRPTAVRRGSGASFAAMGATAGGSGGGASGYADNKWDVWNAIAQGKSDGVVAVNSARSDESSSLSMTSAHGFFGKPLVDLRPTEAQFGGRHPFPNTDEQAVGSQWSSRKPEATRPGLALDLSKIKVAPPNIAAPLPTQSLKLNASDEDTEAEYTILPLSLTTSGYSFASLPARPPIRLGPPGGLPRGLGPPAGFAGIPRGPKGMAAGPRPPPPRLF